MQRLGLEFSDQIQNQMEFPERSREDLMINEKTRHHDTYHSSVVVYPSTGCCILLSDACRIIERSYEAFNYRHEIAKNKYTCVSPRTLHETID